MKTSPVKGTKDIYPEEQRVRDYMQGKILETYISHGFERISTPMLEDIVNLQGSEGGENLGLLFTILKRGQKLRNALENGGELCDMGLRYDLTVPLSRFYANGREKLPNPFKVIQIDRVFRAEQPQQGRLREFYQCDIDIFGAAGCDAEIELIHTTARALQAVGLKDFTVSLNDRRVLTALIAAFGFTPEQTASVCVSLDKLDKIGADGVLAELSEKGFDPGNAEKLTAAVVSAGETPGALARYLPDPSLTGDIQAILDTCRGLSGGQYRLKFDLSLVRGQGYYTGAVFEIAVPGYSGSVGGGGRYDGMVEKFIGEKVPAVGFSIGFERIAAILGDRPIPDAKQRIAVLYPPGEFAAALRRADQWRSEYDVAMYVTPKKAGPFLSRLEARGYVGFLSLDREDGIRFFNGKR